MTNENLDTTNKLIKPEDISPSDDEVIRQLSDNLQDITPEDVDAMCDEMEEAKRIEDGKGWEIPKELKNFREAWNDRIDSISDDTKTRIIKEAEKIPVNVETESFGSRVIEFRLNGKKYKILDPSSTDLVANSDRKFLINGVVEHSGMIGYNVEQWENKGLAKYVKEKGIDGLHIPSKNEMKELFEELGKQINSDKLDDQIAMFMYLTGMNGAYWLSMYDEKSRQLLISSFYHLNNLGLYDKGFETYAANLCMIAYE